MLMSLLPIGMMAEGKGVVITHSNGNISFLEIDGGVNVTFEGDVAKFSGKAISDLEMSITDLANFRIAERPVSKIYNLSAENVDIRFSGSYIIISGMPIGSLICLNDLGGQQIFSSKVNSNGETVINLEKIKQGVYILTTSNGMTYKILKK